MASMAQAAAAAPAIAARRAVRGTALRGKSAAVKPTRSGRGASLECNAFLDQLKKAADGVMKGNPGEKTRVRYQDRVDAINAMGPAVSKLSDDELRAKTKELQAKVAKGADLDSLLAAGLWGHGRHA